MIRIGQQFFAFATIDKTSKKKINAKKCALNSIFFKPTIPQFQHSTILRLQRMSEVKHIVIRNRRNK